MDKKNIESLRICVERMSKQDTTKMKQLKDACKGDKCKFNKLRAAFYTSKLWPQGSTIRIKFLQAPSGVERTSLSRIKNSRATDGSLLQMDPLQETVEGMEIIPAIMKIVKEHVNPFIGLNLKFVNQNDKADIKISFNPSDGAWSLLGTDCLTTGPNEATMNLGWFDVSTTIHEFCHALGMIHEHQNPRGKTIDWDDEKVYKWAADTQGWDKQTTHSNIIEKYDKTIINGSDYDPKSIMLYFFPAVLTRNNVGTDQNLRLSSEDVIYLNQQYPIDTATCKDCMDPATFYQKVYGTPLDAMTTSSTETATGIVTKSETATETSTATDASSISNTDDKFLMLVNFFNKNFVVIISIIVLLFVIKFVTTNNI